MALTVYLKDGRMADLVTKTDKGFLVDPYIAWGHEDEMESAPSGNVELVADVFDTAPVDFIEAHYKKVLERVEEQEKIWEERQKELRQLNSDVQKLRNQKTDISRYIINREELRTAKRLILWPSNQIAPRIMDGTYSHKFTVSYEIGQYQGQERVWCYKLWAEKSDSWSTSEYFDEQYGIKCDLTDEEILRLTNERINRFKKDYHSWQHVLLSTDDQWLSPEYIEEKKQLKEKNKAAEILKAEHDLLKAQQALDKLIAK